MIKMICLLRFFEQIEHTPTTIWTPVEDDMAKNFHICIKERSHHLLALRISGDFDGSSACELINVIDETIKKNGKVAIDTNGLRTVDAFGVNVFLPEMSYLNHIHADVEVTGRFSRIFHEE